MWPASGRYRVILRFIYLRSCLSAMVRSNELASPYLLEHILCGEMKRQPDEGRCGLLCHEWSCPRLRRATHRLRIRHVDQQPDEGLCGLHCPECSCPRRQRATHQRQTFCVVGLPRRGLSGHQNTLCQLSRQPLSAHVRLVWRHNNRPKQEDRVRLLLNKELCYFPRCELRSSPASTERPGRSTRCL